MQFISPCSNGDARSLLVETVWGVRVEEDRIAAPKTLEPEETPSFVRGTMSCSRVLRSAERSSWGVLDAILNDKDVVLE